MTITAYPDYRDSGVPWFETIPSHWRVGQLKHVASYTTSSVDKLSADDELPVRLCNYTDVYYRERIRNDQEFMDATATEREYQRFGLREGDVLITKDSEDWRDIAVPALVESAADDLLCGYHLGIIHPQPDELDGAYLLRAMQASALNRQFQIAATGVTRYGLPNAAVSESILPLPPLDEQITIAAFLDRETDRIDALIAKKREFIERLRERRSALITRVVTRGLPPEAARAAGLDPSPLLKESGVEWLGEVPVHWEMKRLKWSITRLANGIWGGEPDGENDIAVVRVADFNRDIFRIDIPVPTQRAVEPSKLRGRILRDGDLLLEKSGGGAHQLVGCVVLFDGGYPAVTSNFVARMELSGGMVPRFWTYVHAAIYAGRLNYPAIKQTTGIQNLDANAYLDLLAPFPSSDEQAAIAAYLDDEMDRIDATTERVEVAIERLQEYRAALITDAVTGKIDVRNALA